MTRRAELSVLFLYLLNQLKSIHLEFLQHQPRDDLMTISAKQIVLAISISCTVTVNSTDYMDSTAKNHDNQKPGC